MGRNDVTTWNKVLADFLKEQDDEATDVIVAKAPADEKVWDEEFSAGYGGPEGAHILAWSAQWVYFPVCYDGAEWMGRAPRHPRAKGQEHVGGW